VITLFPTNFPAQQVPLIDKDGTMTIPGTNFWKALWNRTGAGTGIQNTVSSTLTAAGTTQADALSLMNDVNNITTTPLNSGAILPSLQPGQNVFVFNYGVNSLNLYPPIGSQINYSGSLSPVNTAVVIPTITLVWCFYMSSTLIYAV